MKRSLLICCLILSACSAWADHITGGEMFYKFLGLAGSNYQYSVTLKLFMRCNSGRQFPNPAIISVFDKGSNSRYQDLSVSMASQQTIQLNADDNPCITDPPEVCYEVAYYMLTVTVPPSSNGYTIASEVNYRIRGISNIGSGQYGATYTCDLPGMGINATYPRNNSARFTGSDLVVVCSNNYFTYSFAASDDDLDRIRYSFCSAYQSTTGGVNGVPAGNPPYSSLPYAGPDFASNTPLGPDVSIDPATGLITGVAPHSGIYVVTVCAEEIRDNIVIAVQRKDLQINITDCSIAGARLERDYMLCRTDRNLVVSNLATSPLIVTYDWSVLNSAGVVLFSSSLPILNYSFAADGIYTVKLVVNKNEQCSDSAKAPVFVFPGTITAFNLSGICITKPTQFTDLSHSPSGTVNSWTWDFGEAGITSDASDIRNPVYTYPSLGTKNIKLTIKLSNGCRDTVSKTVDIIDKPPITLGFRDSLICLNDQLQLQASGQGNFSWSPSANMIAATTGTPTVAPASTTTYSVSLSIDGCINTETVLVRVVDHVTLVEMADTIICTADPILLHINSDALSYSWTPALLLNNAGIANPTATTPAITDYSVIATIGGCTASASIRVTTVDYPLVNAGRDTVICYKTAAFLNASTDGNNWQWKPGASLQNAGSLHPIGHPSETTEYILTAFKTGSGCPKPGVDTVLVTVLPKINANAGRDTAVIIGQPLQLNGSGGERYSWSPPTSLSNAQIADPIALFTEPSTGINYKLFAYDTAGCVDSASITIKVFNTGPTVFVPTAFTPNNDGRNDVLRPIAVGMQRIDYFRVFNRWGQLLFTTSVNGQGWDGRINGQEQGTNSYVWMVKAVDFHGNPYFKRGTVTLIK